VTSDTSSTFFQPENMAPVAEDLVRTSARHGVGLDFSEGSIRVLDTAIEAIRRDGYRPDQLMPLSGAFSAYLGEVMVRPRGAVWIVGDAAPVPDVMRFALMMKVGTMYIAPFVKVHKRFVNGPEDDLGWYYFVNVRDTLADGASLPDIPPPPAFPVSARLRTAWLSRTMGRLFGRSDRE
jgi:hypothetical protein